MAMARFETGKTGNPHYHGFCLGEGNPSLGIIHEEALGAAGSAAAGSGNGDGQSNPVESEQQARQAPEGAGPDDSGPAGQGEEPSDADGEEAQRESDGILIAPVPSVAETRGPTRELRRHGTDECAKRPVVLTSKLERSSQEVSSLEDKILAAAAPRR